ncbi:putative NHN endonuclease [uncultured Caudovirales phage]|uniref:Putative NHN endonuclease n=1 Tax=uncultured Caudovirales phage TaxID=2100421 RepID=A0A6J7VJS7_9CAUD|nr:putative NHN endonuclease [uncultured Caudovirales phage]
MAAQDFTLSQELLHKLFEYKDGVLYWKVANSPRVKVGTKAGTPGGRYGYLQTKINGVAYKNHRLIFMMFNGYIPKEIDHEDTNKLNNRIENLREATCEQNQWNRGIQKNNKSGYKGVSLDKDGKKWIAQCRANGKKHCLGKFTSAEEASKAVKTFRENQHREFARHE